MSYQDGPDKPIWSMTMCSVEMPFMKFESGPQTIDSGSQHLESVAL